MNKLLVLAAGVVAGVGLIHSSAQAANFGNCTTSSCTASVVKCIEFRTRRALSSAELPCERSGDVCRKTGIWRGKYMRGTPEVNECAQANR